MKDEWSESRQFSVEAVGSRKPDCLLLQFSYYVSIHPTSFFNLTANL